MAARICVEQGDRVGVLIGAAPARPYRSRGRCRAGGSSSGWRAGGRVRCQHGRTFCGRRLFGVAHAARDREVAGRLPRSRRGRSAEDRDERPAPPGPAEPETAAAGGRSTIRPGPPPSLRTARRASRRAAAAAPSPSSGRRGRRDTASPRRRPCGGLRYPLCRRAWGSRRCTAVGSLTTEPFWLNGRLVWEAAMGSARAFGSPLQAAATSAMRACAHRHQAEARIARRFPPAWRAALAFGQRERG